MELIENKLKKKKFSRSYLKSKWKLITLGGDFDAVAY